MKTTLETRCGPRGRAAARREALDAVRTQRVEAVDARVTRLEQGREGGNLAALLDQDRARRGPEGVHGIVVPIDMARQPVQRLDVLELVAADAEVRYARARHDPCRADDEGALKTLLAGRAGLGITPRLR